MREIRTAVLAALLCLWSVSSVSQDAPPRVVQVAEVTLAEVAPTVAVPGTVHARDEMRVTAGVNGRLTMVAEPGVALTAGSAVAEVDTTALRLQRAEQEALLARAEISLTQLESQVRRQRELIGSRLVSEFELEQTESNRDLAASDAAIIRVRIRQIDDQIERAVVRAPFDGVVVSRERRAGEEVVRGEMLAQLTDVMHLEVRAFVPLKHLPRVAVDAAIDVFAGSGQFTGSIRSLVPTGDVRSQTFEARIDLPADAAASWTVGQLVSVAVPISAGREALTVPRDALVLRSSGTYVMRINDDNKAERIEIEVGDSAGDIVAISGELMAGDRVAIRGAENLSEGAAVKIVAAEGDRAGGAPDRA